MHNNSHSTTVMSRWRKEGGLVVCGETAPISTVKHSLLCTAFNSKSNKGAYCKTESDFI